MNLPKHLLPTTVVGSYPQPEWLVDRAMLSKSVPRTRMHEMWRLPAEHLEEAQDDASGSADSSREPNAGETDDIQQFNAWLEGLKKS